MNTQRYARCALLTSLALCLSCLERMLPLQLIFPLPGIKLGLANVVTLIALPLLGSGCALIILLMRCLLGAIFSGSVTSLLFSLCGGVLALIVMMLAGHIPFLSIYGISMLGSAAHGVGQIILAMLFIPSARVGIYLSYLLLASLLTGMASALMGAGVLRALCSQKKTWEVS